MGENQTGSAGVLTIKIVQLVPTWRAKLYFAVSPGCRHKPLVVLSLSLRKLSRIVSHPAV